MSARSKARKRALDLTFAAEARGRAPGEFLDEQLVSGERPSNDYTVELVQGVDRKRQRIDELIRIAVADGGCRGGGGAHLLRT